MQGEMRLIRLLQTSRLITAVEVVQEGADPSLSHPPTTMSDEMATQEAVEIRSGNRSRPPNIVLKRKWDGDVPVACRQRLEEVGWVMDDA